ncbi:unnamed protein product, partial [Laminaria digitata]
MQFDHEESGEERRRRQRDYHAFLDAQVEARRKAPPPARDDVEAARLPILPPSGRLKHQHNPPLHGADANLSFAKYGDMSRLQAPRGADGGGGSGGGGGGVGLGGNLDRAGVSSYLGEYLHKLEQRLETEVQRRGLLEREVGTLGQKLQNWMADSTASISSLDARDAAVTEVREQARYLDAQLVRVQERQHRIETTLALAPKVQEMTQQQVKALEEEARTRIKADEVRAVRFGQAVERVSGEVQSLAARLGAEENGTSQRVAILEAALTGEAKGTREATKQLGEHLKALDAAYSGSESNMDALCQSLRRLEARQEEQHLFAGGITEQLVARQQTQARIRHDVTYNLYAKPLWSCAMYVCATRLRGFNHHLNHHRLQESLTTATSEKLDALKDSLANELAGMMADTAKRVVESTNVPQAITLLKGRVEITEERLANVADKSFRSLEEELAGLRAEVTRLERQIEADPAAAGLAALGSSMTTAQEETQSQLRELQDTLSAEITARRRNALRLAEAQAASTEGGRESAVQTASGLRARCLELEEVVARLTQDVHTAQEELSSQTQAQLSATQERNSRAVGKLEESLAGERLVAQQDADRERIWAKSSARADELEALIADTKDSLREADERTRSALAATEARRQGQGQQLLDKLAAAKSEEMARTDAVEHALGEHRQATREAVETGYRANRTRSDELHAEMQSLEERLTAMVEDAQRNESARAEAILHKTQEQASKGINREVSKVFQATDRVATDTHDLRALVLAEETSRTNDVQSLQRDIPKMTEAAELRMRLWAEGRLQSERATTEGVLERTQAESGMVRALLDEAVSAISKELNMQKVEWKARSVALEDLLDELVSGLEARLTEVDNGAAKKRRLGDLTKETGARIGEIERRVRQAEQELKDDLEVKLAVSSLVCAVSDQASTQKLEQRASEELKLEKKRKIRATANEGKLKAELGKTNATVSSLQADLGAATAWRLGVDELESKLMARIEELKAMAEAARSAAATATADAAAARKAEAEATLAKEEAAAELARAKEAAAAAAAEGDTGTRGQKVAAKKVTDFAAMNDELEADDSSASSSSPEDEQFDDDNADGGLSALKPRVRGIEEDLKELKLRLEEGITEMAALRQEMLAVMSTRPPPSSGNGGGDGDGTGGVRERRQPKPKRSSGRAAGRRERATETYGASPRSVRGGGGGGEETDSSSDKERNNTPPLSPKSSGSYIPPLSPASGADHTPPLSPNSDVFVTARGGDVTDASDARSEKSAGNVGSGSDSESASNSDDGEAGDRRSRRSDSRAGSTTASEGEDAGGRNVEESDDGESSDASNRGDASRRSDAESASNSDDDSSGGDGDDGGGLQEEEEGEEEEEEEEEEEASDDEGEEDDSDRDSASGRGSVLASARSDEDSDQQDDDDGGRVASDASDEETDPEGSSASEEDEGGASGDGEGSDLMSERGRPESQRSSS